MRRMLSVKVDFIPLDVLDDRVKPVIFVRARLELMTVVPPILSEAIGLANTYQSALDHLGWLHLETNHR